MMAKRYGVITAEERISRSGLELVQALVAGALPLNSMARTLGYDIVEAERGRVVVAGAPNAEHLNPHGTVHAGFVATMLDSAMGLAVQTMLGRGVGSTTLEFKISLLRPITPESGLIRVEGTVISSGRRVGTAEGRALDQAGRVLAHGTTTCLILEA